jgi:hypothetical protein
MQERWYDGELDEPDLGGDRAFPAPGRPARLHWAPGSGVGGYGRGGGQAGGARGRDNGAPGRSEHIRSDGGGEHGLRWPPVEMRWPEPEPHHDRAGSGRGSVGARRDGDAGGVRNSSAASLDWLLDDPGVISEQTQEPPLSQADGAPSGIGGRFAAEWSPPGTSSRSSRRMPLLPEREIRVEKNGGVMARRALLERSDQLTADDEALPLQPHSARPDQVMPHWRGAGGRWLVWVARAIAWAVLLLIGYRGVAAIIEGPSSSRPASPSATSSGTQHFPVTMAEAVALEFGRDYLNFSPASAAARSASLASFLPPGYDRSLGWNGAGTQRMLDEQVAAVSVTGPHTAVVTLLAQLGGGKLIELGVPIYAANGGMSVSGKPALLAGPAKAIPPGGRPSSFDQATASALRNQLPAFFRAYASGDQATLARFAARGARIAGLGGDVSLASVDSVFVPAGGSTRQVSVTVTWDLQSASAVKLGSIGAAPAALEMTYQLTIVRQGGSWDIRSIGASTQQLASGPP